MRIRTRYPWWVRLQRLISTVLSPALVHLYSERTLMTCWHRVDLVTQLMRNETQPVRLNCNACLPVPILSPQIFVALYSSATTCTRGSLTKTFVLSATRPTGIWCLSVRPSAHDLIHAVLVNRGLWTGFMDNCLATTFSSSGTVLCDMGAFSALVVRFERAYSLLQGFGYFQ